MRLFLMMLFLLFLNNCTTVEVTKEIIKAGTSAKNNVSKITQNVLNRFLDKKGFN